MRTNSVRAIAVLAVAAGSLWAADTAGPSSIPRFSDYPFEQIAAGPERAAIKWEVHLLPPQLSVHQRLMERVQAVVPGTELAKRRGRGELVMLVRFEDSDGRRWRTGSRLNLAKVQEGVKSEVLTFTVAAFVRPGEYKVSVALIDTESKEHSFTRRMLHVAPLRNDPLPDAWAGLPAVEVLPAIETPEAWYLPEVRGSLRLPAGSKSGDRAPKVDLLVNVSPSNGSFNPSGAQRRNMAVVMPALKVLSGLNAENRPPSAAVMDVTRQRIGLEAANAGRLDWRALGRLLTASNPSVIDAKSLAAQSSMREYFAREVVRRAGESGPPRWLIVMSGPLMFSKQNETPLPHMAFDPNRHIVYLCFVGGFGRGALGGGGDPQIRPAERVRGPMPGLGTVIPMPPGRGRGEMMFPDDIEHVLKPMGAQIIAVQNAEGFRKVVAGLIADIGAN